MNKSKNVPHVKIPSLALKNNILGAKTIKDEGSRSHSVWLYDCWSFLARK